MPPDPQLRWLRLWTDIVSDPKIRLLAFEDRWHYVALLCMKRSGHLECASSLLERTVAVTLGLIERDASEVKRRLMEVGLISEHWQPLAWEKRQFSSDLSTNRVRAFRKRFTKQDETSRKRSRNAPETETESESEYKRARKRAASASAEFPLDFALTEVLRAQALERAADCDADAAFEQFRAHHQANGSKFKSWPAAWRTWIGNFERFGYPKRKPAMPTLADRLQEKSGWR